MSRDKIPIQEIYSSLYQILVELEREILRVKYLSLVKEKNIVLVGGNGAGKSSFASYLKESLSDNIVVIPAQKYLFFDLKINNLHLTKKSDINNIQRKDYIQLGRFESESSEYAVTRYVKDLSELFSRFVTVIVNEQIKQQNNIFETKYNESDLLKIREETILYKLNSLWRNLIPDIQFEIDTTNRVLIPNKKGEKFTLNAMSDGEKAMIYYIAYVLLAEPDSFIVVDEPETFLNASNFNRLWDTLEAYRPDCKFIYISHVVDFIVSRTDADLLWSKNFNYPDEWEIEPIDADSELAESFPRELLSELLGARKPILFCEGKKSSLDYSIYSSMFKNDVIVYPVEGHNEVIQYTKSYNRLTGHLNGNKAVGIIDADLMYDEQIKEYEKNSIYTLNFNEIEMLLLTDEVMYEVLIGAYSDDEEVRSKIADFKRKFMKIMEEEITKVVFEKNKKYIDYRLSNYRVNKSKRSEEISLELEELIQEVSDSINVDIFKNKIESFLENEEYTELLKVCPLKEQISKGLANSYLDSNYENKALNKIKTDETFSKKIKEKYFQDLESEILSLF